jgi:16S rRNA (adenine1518-N6/adenine1519-N6)-dimethyltransferase
LGRRFGQHFLARASILERIAQAACAGHPALVVEIGPGRGALTAPLLARAPRVVAIEVDPVLVLYLRQKFQEAIAAGRLVLVEGDVLQTGLGAWGPCAVAGNLPYYITSPVLERLFAAAGAWERALFLVQAEVAERLAAAPGSRAYGYLSVFAQVHARVTKLFEVPRAAFRPPPKVDSAVVELTPRDARADFGIGDVAGFLKFAGACFRHKRKTLRNNLAQAYPAQQWEWLGRRRAEELGIEELARTGERVRG